MSAEEIKLTNDNYNKGQSFIDSADYKFEDVIDAQYKLLSDLYLDISNSILPGIVNQLQEMKDGALLSGEDSGMENVWEEICVQIQNEKSFEWPMYVITIEGIIEKELDKLPHSFKQVISYMSGLNDEPDMTGYFPHHAIESIKDDLFSVAMNYSNQRIEDYLYG